MGDAPIKINLGSGRLKRSGFVSIDLTQIIDGKGNKTVDIVMDIEKEPLPYEDSTVEEVVADNVLEHIGELRYVMNECHRVLKKGGHLKGMVPMAGTRYDFKDPTHKRHFVPDTFGYFCGQSEVNADRPKHPKYADYGYKAWTMNRLDVVHDGLLIEFDLSPRK